MLMHFFPALLCGALLITITGIVRRENWKLDVVIAIAFALYPLANLPLIFITKIHPHTIDANLYQIDLWMGIDPLKFFRYVLERHWLFVLLTDVYGALPIMMALAWVLERSRLVLKSMAVAPVVAMLCYALIPAVGPAHAVVDIATAPRNAFPSMHLSWALLIALGARGKLWKAATWSFIGLTALATVGLGEHYVIDLLAAVPFVLGIRYFLGKEQSSDLEGYISLARF